MKKLLILIGIFNLYLFSFSQTYLIEGNAFLENQLSHSEIEITFNRIAPTPLTYTVYTDSAGYFSENVEEGIYNISYEKDGYITATVDNFSFYSPTVLPDITLESEGLSGDISGVLSAGIYKVSGDITVPEGLTLNIEPGTSLLFKQDINFIIRGSIYSNGTVDDSIVFMRFENGINWGGISIYSESGNSDFSFVRIENSSSSGIYIGGNCSIDHSTICNNTGNYGGGINIHASEILVFITNTKIFQNLGNLGGGIYFALTTDNNTQPERPVISNCLIYNNTANIGSGIYFYLWYYGGVRSPLISNCVFYGNECFNGNAGTLDCDQQSVIPTITNNIIANNVGYGTKFTSNTQYFGFNNSFNNSLGNYFNPPPNVGNNVTTNENGSPCDAYHNIQLNPMFVDGDNYDFHLLEGSLCIDVGLNDSVYNDLDFDNNVRIWDGNNNGTLIVDAGPYEYGAIVNDEELNKGNTNFNCYPNPTDGIVNFEFSDGEIQEIVITDVGGRILIKTIGNEQNQSIDLSDYESGIYIVRVFVDKGEFITKLLKK